MTANEVLDHAAKPAGKTTVDQNQELLDRLNAIRERTPPRPPRPAFPTKNKASASEDIDRFVAEMPPRDAAETLLVARAVRLAQDIDQADRDEAEIAVREYDAACLRELNEVDRLGNLLLAGEDARGRSRSRNAEPPAALLRTLESTGDGCRWLIDRWMELTSLFAFHLPFRHGDLLRVLRLTGKRPADLRYDEELNGFLAAWEFLCPGLGQTFFEACMAQSPDHDPEMIRHQTWRPLHDAPTTKREAYVAIDRVIGRRIAALQRRVAQLEAREPSTAVTATSPLIQKLRRLQQARSREFRLTMNALRKGRVASRPASAAEKTMEPEVISTPAPEAEAVLPIEPAPVAAVEPSVEPAATVSEPAEAVEASPAPPSVAVTHVLRIRSASRPRPKQKRPTRPAATQKRAPSPPRLSPARPAICVAEEVYG